MKKLLLVIALLLASAAVNAQAIYENFYCANLPYTDGRTSCPHTVMWNRSHTKIIAEYQPGFPQYFSWGAMNVWRIGYPKGGSWYFTTQDWQDVNDAKLKTGGWWRWGICFSGQAANETCLF